jgi:hypothetical protein
MFGYDFALQRTRKGKTTGPFSRILSWINLHVYIFIIVTLIKDQQYIPLAILTILVLTPIAPLAMLVGAGYFGFIRYWTGVGLLVLTWIVGFLSVRFGVRYNEKLVRGRAATIDPFENMPEAAIPTIIELIAFGVALLTNGCISVVAWAIFAIATSFLLMRYWFRIQSGWARLHYPLMLRYSALAGEEAAKAKLNDRKYSLGTVLSRLVKSGYPSWSQEEVNTLIDTAREKLVNFTDREELLEYFGVRKSYESQDGISDLISLVEKEIRDQVGMDVKLRGFVIAEIVNREYGESERTEYVAGLITGRIT